MKKYKITFTGRTRGAIGIFYKITDTRIAEDKDKAILALYGKYEHIHVISIIEVKQ